MSLSGSESNLGSHSAFSSPIFFVSCNLERPQSLPIFHDHDAFEASHSYFVSCLSLLGASQDEIQIMHFRQENHRDDVVLAIVHQIRRHVMPVCPVAAELNRGWCLLKLVSFSLCTVKAPFSLLSLVTALWGNTLRFCKYHASCHTFAY